MLRDMSISVSYLGKISESGSILNMKCRTQAQGQEVYVGKSSVQCYQPLKLEAGSGAK